MQSQFAAARDGGPLNDGHNGQWILLHGCEHTFDVHSFGRIDPARAKLKSGTENRTFGPQHGDTLLRCRFGFESITQRRHHLRIDRIALFGPGQCYGTNGAGPFNAD